VDGFLSLGFFVGVRVGLPLGRLPPLLGVELRFPVEFGWAGASLLLASDGRTLILGEVDYALGGVGALGTSYAWLAGGLHFLDLRAALPSMVAGVGLSHRIAVADGGPEGGLAAGLLLPIALGPPLVTLGGGWTFQ
jgi:hypothetical protein